MAYQKRMDNSFSLEALAIGVAHAVYRNTAVEDYHAEGRRMDDALYEDVRRIVSEKAALLIKRMPLLLCAHRNGWASIRTLNNISPEETSFFQEVVFGILCGSGWEAPHKIDLHIGGNIAEFLLAGEFRKHCDGAHRLDDAAMKPINKDIVDRVYCVLKRAADEA